MNRRLQLTLLTVAVAGLWAAAPGARADRLGGNFRGPGDQYIVRDDTSNTAPSAGGQAGGGSAPASEGGTSSSGDSTSGGQAPPPDSGGGGSAPPDSGGGGSAPPDSGGGSAPPDSGGGGSAPPDSGGGSTSGGGTTGDTGGSTGGGTTAPDTGGTGTSSAPSNSPTSTGSGGLGGKKANQDDKDRIWPFYIEGNKEEYILTVFSRRPDTRIAPPRTSSYLLSNQPEPARHRRIIGDSDRQEARDLVLGRLQDSDSHVRDAAVLALGKSGFKEAVPLLVKSAENDGDPAVREDALLALGLSGQADVAQSVLLKALKSNASDRRERRVAYAALGLGLLGKAEGAVEPLRQVYEATALRQDMPDEAACAAAALGMLGDADAIPLFEKVLASRGASDTVRSFTLHALGKYGSAADEKVRKAALKAVLMGIESGKDIARESGLLALGSFDDPAAIAFLVKEGFSKADNYAKNFAAHSLGRIAGRAGPGSREYVLIAKELAKISDKDSKDSWLFQAGTIALSSMACGDHEKVLVEHLGELSKLKEHSKSAVVLALGLLGTDDQAVLKQLETAQGSRNSGTNVQAYAGLALALADAPSATRVLGKTLNDEGKPNAEIARTSALALGLVGGADEAKVLVEVLTGQKAALPADTNRFFLKGAAVQGLGIIGDADSIRLLKPSLTSNEWESRAFATAALGYLMEPDARHRVSTRVSEIFRHHNYHAATGVVKQVQSTL